MSNFKRVVNIIPLRRLNLGKAQIFTYLVPLQLEGQMRPGQIVKVPFGAGSTSIFGVVSSLEMHRLQTETKGLKNLTTLHDAAAWLTEKNLALANWLAEYYLSPLGLVVKATLPKPVKKATEPSVMGYEHSNPDFLLTEHQRLAVSAVVTDADRAGTFLLHGPRGSGKTEVCLQIISRLVDSGKQIIYLVPEIESLQKIQEPLIRRFGLGKIAVLHGQLRDRERLWQWRKIHNGEKQIILGTRSAIFAPVKNLGAIIIDEEHHSSYKQYDQQPKYDARMAAKKLSELWKRPLIFASSTPSVNLYFEAKSGKAKLLELPGAIKADLHSPHVKLAPASQQRALSPALLTEITQALLRKQPTLLVFSKYQSGRLGDELQALLLEEFRRDKPEVIRLTQNQILVDPSHKQAPLAVVGVLDADFYLNWQDFRAAERSFTHLSALADKLGPGQLPGVLVLQSKSPDHYVMQALKNHSYEQFFLAEIARRQAANDPPFSRLIKISTTNQAGGTEILKVLKIPLEHPLSSAELLKDIPGGADIDVDPESLI